MNKVGILHHPYHPESLPMAQRLAEVCEKQDALCWIASAWDEKTARAKLDGTDLLICVGGDGTILRAAQLSLAKPISIIGVSMGRFGFLSELSEAEAVAKLPEVLAGAGWIEERTMVQAAVLPGGEDKPGLAVHHGLNEVTVSRASPARPVYVAVHIDGQYLATYRADGVIISTATGSTAYNLAAGGPIMHPTAQSLILKPVAPHMGLPNSLVLPPEAKLSLAVGTDNEAVMNVDGQLDLRLNNGDTVLVKRSPHVARFIRIRPRTYFYANLVAKLGYTAKANGYPDSGSSSNHEDRSR